METKGEKDQNNQKDQNHDKIKNNQKVKWGGHFSTSKYQGDEKTDNLDDLIKIAIKRDWKTMQIFFGSNKAHKYRRKVSEEEIKRCKILCDDNDFQLYTHFPYTMNLVKPKSHTELSGLQAEMDRLAPIKARVVIHPNSPAVKGGVHNKIIKEYAENPTAQRKNKFEKWRSQCTLAINVLSSNVRKLNFPHQDFPLLLEPPAGEGQKIGFSLEQMKLIREKIDDLPIGFCIDTCHVFASGVCDFSSKESVDKFFDELEEIKVLERVKVIHFNDSADPFYSLKDHHAGLCTGYIWNEHKLDGLYRLAEKCEIHKIDIICEVHALTDFVICRELFGPLKKELRVPKKVIKRTEPSIKKKVKKFPAEVYKGCLSYGTYSTIEEAATFIAKIEFVDIEKAFEENNEYKTLEEYVDGMDRSYFYKEEHIRESVIEDFSEGRKFSCGGYYWSFTPLKTSYIIKYINGDATRPQKQFIGEELRIILHICNDVKKWGKGFVMALSKKWELPRKKFMKMESILGTISHCWVCDELSFYINGGGKIGDDVCVINMIAQEGIYEKNGIPPIRYEALKLCFNEVLKYLENYQEKLISIHMPRIGCGLAGGKWDEVETIINEVLIKEEKYPVVVYDLI